MVNHLKNRNMPYVGHIMINTSGYYSTLMRTIEKQTRKMETRTNMVDDLRDWTGTKQYNLIKRGAEKRNLYGTLATHSSERNKESINTIANTHNHGGTK